ncbi:MAG: SpoIID/LytB domain-containing protein [Elusimicrobia bacterium]|nr:SpoIID/LytB domain-containing protein [Elusimicrobiota bacterium]
MRRLGPLLALLLAVPPAAQPTAARLADRIVAVALFAGAQAVSFRPFGAFRVIDQATGEITKLESGREYKVEADASRGRAELIFGPHLFRGPTRLLPGQPGEYVEIGERRYSGNLLFRPNKDRTVTVVDEMGVEEYLFGVLPHEMSPDWPLEALKAQAVVSRSYALASLGGKDGGTFDLTDDDTTQLYTGLDGSTERVKQAVRDTAGQVLTWKGQPLKAFFHSTCAGHTADARDVWGREAPEPLKGVRDRWCRISPYSDWTATFTAEDIRKALARHGVMVGSVEDVSKGSVGTGGWLRTIRVRDSRGWHAVDANDFRLWLGPREMKSVKLRSIRRKWWSSSFTFTGRGYGHGVGLCQWGARAQAQAGFGYKDILSHYFPGAKLETFTE